MENSLDAQPVNNEKPLLMKEVKATGNDDNEVPSTSTEVENDFNQPHSSDCFPSCADSSNSLRECKNPINDTFCAKRKFEGNENETRKFKRQRKYRHVQTERNRGKKRKFPFDHIDQPRKRFKSSPVENEPENLEQNAITTKIFTRHSVCDTEIDRKSQSESSCANPNLNTEDNNTTDIQPVPGTSGNNSNKESRGLDIDEADDNIPCPPSCVCKAGHSQLPSPIRRYFECPVPLRRSLLMHLSYSDANKRYTCCPSRCVRVLRRSEVRRFTIFHMTEDYDDQSDLRVHRYSWGEWKE